RGYRIVDTLDLEPGGERRRRRRGHRLGHRERADALRTLGARGVGGFDDGARRRAARPHDDAGTLVGNVMRLEAGVLNRLLHGDMIPCRALGEKTHRAAIDHIGWIERRRTLYLRSESEFRVLLRTRDA